LKNVAAGRKAAAFLFALLEAYKRTRPGWAIQALQKSNRAVILTAVNLACWPEDYR